jgi:hypothetical protein
MREGSVMRMLRWALALWVAVLVAGCATFGGSRVITLSQDELTRLVERQFPLDRRLLEVVDVKVGAPTLRLLPERNRLATELQVDLAERLFGRAIGGRIALDYALRWDAQAQALKLADVRVASVQLDAATGTLGAAARGLGPLLAEQMLEGAAIYRPKPEDLRDKLGGRWQPGAVTVTSRGVEIALERQP